jgi:uncharacterized protein with HEPN domain
MSRDDAYLLDVLNAARLAVEFLGDHDERAFGESLLIQSAVQHPLLIVGEAVKRLSPDARQAHPAIPWRQIAGMRDHLAHAYGCSGSSHRLGSGPA